jgi:hypothetical protein
MSTGPIPWHEVNRIRTPDPEPRTPNPEPRPGRAAGAILLTGVTMTQLTDDELIDRFERVDLAEFRHRDHVHLAWAYLKRDGRDRALDSLVQGLTRFAASKGHPEKFHYTLTRAWLDLIAGAAARHPGATTAAALLAQCPALADPRTVRQFYSDALLASDRARSGWVDPDLSPIGLP